jgi:DNA (cytosine-5)-methyltransferase 1
MLSVTGSPGPVVGSVCTGYRGLDLGVLAAPADSASARREVDWSVYAPAVRRWERMLERGAPCPTQPGRHGRPVLAPAFVEWLQGLQPGWVTSLPLPRTAQLRALGNGVVPQQAAYAVGLLLADLAVLLGNARDERRGHGPEADAA